MKIIARKIEKIREDYCTGCSACYNVCPVNAIEIVEDKEGYYKPRIRVELCIDCGQCDKVCPIINRFNNSLDYKKLYAVWADDETRLDSSSGGAFTIFAKRILDIGGVVFGAGWGKNFILQHKYIDKKEDLFLLQKSKYLQSYIGKSYQDVEKFLLDGRYVMFVGTPCQVEALKNYIKQKRIDEKKLVIFDLYCHNSPSYLVFKNFIDTNFGYKLQQFGFRLKVDNIYTSHMFSYKLEGEDKKIIKELTSFFKGYFPLLYMPKHCQNCSFQGENRVGDISLGDFWGIEAHDKTWNDGKGTSMVLVNTQKGKAFFDQMESQFKRIEETPLSWIRSGQGVVSKPHPNRNYFYKLLEAKVNFNKAVDMALSGQQFDIGLACVLVYHNYGSALTNYAFYYLLKSYNQKVLIINQPLSSIIKPNEKQFFAKNPFEVENCAGFFSNKEQMKALNIACKKFVVGSDQLFNAEIYKLIDGFVKLDWVDDMHPKIAYATSFGVNQILGGAKEEKEFRHCIRRFDSVSVRESWGEDLVKNHFGIIAKYVLDPVFLCGKDVWECLVAPFENETHSSGLFVYVLDPTEEKGNFVKHCSSLLNLPLSVTSDRARDMDNIKKCWDIETLFPSSNEMWLSYLKNSDFVIADSFHALSFSLIFKKPFLLLKNTRRGNARAEDLLHLTNLAYRIVDEKTEKDELLNIINTPIDWEQVEAALESRKKESIMWIEKNIINV